MNKCKIDEVDMVEESRRYLKGIQNKYFHDDTFTEYISKGLAGDFAYEIAIVVASLKEECILCGEPCYDGVGTCDFCDGGGK